MSRKAFLVFFKELLKENDVKYDDVIINLYYI
jgi:hypothetical protein